MGYVDGLLCVVLLHASRLVGASAGVEKVYPVDLEWKDVSCSVGNKALLHGVSGKAGAGRLLAVMGPSGSGKTTLLNALAGQVPYSKRTQLHGRLRVGGAERDIGQDQAYVKQEDVFYSQLTVRETLLMAARLRLPRSVPLGEKIAMVDELMNKLGLSKVADTIVGDNKTRGISGGEKKRLSIACQLFGTPSLIFCDEPTTGLDSFQAERVMSTLRQLAKDGHTVIFSIHQPRSSIFRMFDDLIVLSEGRVMFQGPARRVASHFRSKGHAMPANTNPGEFAIDIVSVDYASKDAEEQSKRRIDRFATDSASSSSFFSNPWTSPSASSSASGKGNAFSPLSVYYGGGGGTGGSSRSRQEDPGQDRDEDPEEGPLLLRTRKARHGRRAALAARRDLPGVVAAADGGDGKLPSRKGWFSGVIGSGAEEGKESGGGEIAAVRRRRGPGPASGRGQRAGPLEQFRLLLSRSWRQVNRAKFANVTRVVANLGSAVIFGSIFWKLGMGQSHINDRIGLLQTAVIQCAMSTVAKSLVTFPTESTIVKAERSLNMYSVLPYFLSKMIAELPISALFPNIFGVILYQMTGLHPKRDRLLKFLGVLTVEAFAASALGMLIGCVAKDGDAAMAIGPPVMTVFILFSGFYITQDNVPRPLRWVKDASLIKHAFEALCVNELEGLEFDCDTKSRGPCIRTGEQMLARVAFDESTVAGATLGLSKILGSCWLLTYLTLALANPRFQTMVDPSLLASSPAAVDRVRGGGRRNRRGVLRRWRRQRRQRRRVDTGTGQTAVTAGKGSSSSDAAAAALGRPRSDGGKVVLPMLRRAGGRGFKIR